MNCCKKAKKTVTKSFFARLTVESENEGGENVTQSSAEKLYEACYMRVFSYAMTLTGDRGEAEEITQETMFRAISKQNRPYHLDAKYTKRERGLHR